MKQPRILVIDDESGIRFTFKKLLSGAGYEVETAASCEEGLASIAESEFDVVFADIILGGRTGLDILREVKARGLSSPLVLITGRPDIDTAAEAVRLGAFDYLPKPVRKQELLRVAGQALTHKSIIDEKERYSSNLEVIFNGAKDVIVLVDESLRVIELNEAAGRVCGFFRDIVGRRIAPPLKGCKGRCIEALKAALESRAPVEVHRFECEPEARLKRVISVTAAPLFQPDGALSRAVMVVRDEAGPPLPERTREDRQHFHRIVGRSEKMQKIYSLAENLANVQTSVLITGESGTGKELLAEAIHCQGEHGEKPLVKVNCAALSESLLESELFGHVKGAFTGAIKDKTGRFQLADGGTIFLDEIGDISSGVQQRLLRVLQEKEFERVGDSTPIRVNVRVIAATNKNLPEEIIRGEFREDLYYRLKVVEIMLPPLREKREDIPLLVEHFIRKFNAKFHKSIDGLSEDALRLFMSYSWPGNVRELAHALEHAFIFCPRDIITVAHLPSELENSSEAPVPPTVLEDEGLSEIESITQALRKAAGNKAKAARLLGISRRTIYRKIEELNIKAHEQPDCA